MPEPQEKGMVDYIYLGVISIWFVWYVPSTLCTQTHEWKGKTIKMRISSKYSNCSGSDGKIFCDSLYDNEKHIGILLAIQLWCVGHGEGRRRERRRDWEWRKLEFYYQCSLGYNIWGITESQMHIP